MAGGTSVWVLLSYRMPREPSTRRIAVWRKLERLGVARLGDGLVALPADARTREQLEWLAEEIDEGGGSSVIWLGRPGSSRQEREIAAAMSTARAAEYTALAAEAIGALSADAAVRAAASRKLRAELRRIVRRDFFPPPQRDAAQAALAALAMVSGRATEKSSQRKRERI